MADEATATDTTAKSQMIEIGYTVQNPHITPSAARAVIGGKEMVATVDAFEVELVADSMSNGGIKLRFIGDEIPAAQALFINDSKVKAQFVGG
jgi:hypothetical protein